MEQDTNSPELTPDEALIRARAAGALAFYRSRFRWYAGLVVFIVLVGAPMLAVPQLRARLVGRAHALRAAISGTGNTAPLSARVGENPMPLPPEYERVIAPRPQVTILPPPGGVYGAGGSYTVGGEKRAAAPARAGEEREPAPEPAPAAPAGETEAADNAGAEPQYGQGQIEREAYEAVLKANPAAAALVQGGNSALRFKSWAAARRDDDTYWVRLLFTNVADNSEAVYIWQVKPQGGQVAPLNYNARSLLK